MITIGSTTIASVRPPASRLRPSFRSSRSMQRHEDRQPEQPVDDGGHAGQVAHGRVQQSRDGVVGRVLLEVDRRRDADGDARARSTMAINRIGAEQSLGDARLRRIGRQVDADEARRRRAPVQTGSERMKMSASSQSRKPSEISSARNSRPWKMHSPTRARVARAAHARRRPPSPACCSRAASAISTRSGCGARSAR